MRNRLKFILSNLPELIAGITLFSAIGITTVNGVGRYLFSRTLVWNDEVVAICFAYTVFFGSAAACMQSAEGGGR